MNRLCSVKYVTPWKNEQAMKENLSSGFQTRLELFYVESRGITKKNQRTNGPVNAHLVSWPSKAQNIQNLENKW